MRGAPISGELLLKPKPVYPVLASLYFVLALAAGNGSELVHLPDLGRPISLSLAVCAVAWALGFVLAGGFYRGALTALLVVVSFGMFRVIYEPLKGILAAKGEEATLVFVMAYLLPFAIFGLRKYVRKPEGPTRYLNIVTLLLVGWSGIEVARNTMPSREGTAKPAPISEMRSTTGRDQRPDIYLIVLDKYTSSRVLARNYGYDNRSFEDALRQRGFVVPEAARANYIHTMLALASMLNLRYLDDFPERFGVKNPQWGLSYPFIEDNQLQAYLRARKYAFIFCPSAFMATRRNRNADEQLPSPDAIRPEFETLWLYSTPLPTLHRIACRILGCLVNVFPYVPESADLLDWKFQHLAELGRRPQRKFVFAHLALPHEPYLYWHDCSHREPFWPLNDNDQEAVKRAYIEQIRCVNQKVLTLIDEIQRQSGTPPVILLQADHGHGRFGRLAPRLELATPDQVEERASIFAAYYLPGVRAAEVSDSISPVNVTRLVLRHYFGADLPPVEDATYWSGWDQPYRFIRVH